MSQLARVGRKRENDLANHEPLPTATPPSQYEAEAETIRGWQRPGNVPGWQRADTGKQISDGVGLA
jgi:hypothetical protein